LWKQLDITSRTACYSDDDTAVSWVDSGSTSSAASNIKDYGIVLTDSYEARTGYYNFMRTVAGTTSLTTVDSGIKQVAKFKASTSVMSRGIIGNVQLDDTTRYNDRVYVSPPDKPSTFLETRYFTVGQDDGDAIQAIEYIGNYLLAVIKRNHIYIINISSVSEANWSLVKAFYMGTEKARPVKTTEYGLCMTNNQGVWLITSDLQLIELSPNLDWSTHWGNMTNPTGWYDGRNKEYLVSLDNGWVLVFDLRDRYVSWQRLHSTVSSDIFFHQGKVDQEVNCAIWENSTPTFTLYKITGSAGADQSTKLTTFPIRLPNKYHSMKVKDLYITFKGNADYGTSVSKTGDVTAGTNLTNYATRGIQKIRIGQVTNFLRIAVDDFSELEEIALLVVPHSSRRLDESTGVAA